MFFLSRSIRRLAESENLILAHYLGHLSYNFAPINRNCLEFPDLLRPDDLHRPIYVTESLKLKIAAELCDIVHCSFTTNWLFTNWTALLRFKQTPNSFVHFVAGSWALFIDSKWIYSKAMRLVVFKKTKRIKNIRIFPFFIPFCLFIIILFLFFFVFSPWRQSSAWNNFLYENLVEPTNFLV